MRGTAGKPGEGGLQFPSLPMPPIRHLRWYIGGLLFLSTVINYIDRQTLSVLAPYLKVRIHAGRTPTSRGC